MPDKKNEELNEEEIAEAVGGAGQISASKTEKRSSLEPTARGVIEDPLGPPTSTGEPSVKP